MKENQNKPLSEIIANAVLKTLQGLEINTDVQITLTRVTVDITHLTPVTYTINCEWYEI